MRICYFELLYNIFEFRQNRWVTLPNFPLWNKQRRSIAAVYYRGYQRWVAHGRSFIVTLGTEGKSARFPGKCTAGSSVLRAVRASGNCVTRRPTRLLPSIVRTARITYARTSHRFRYLENRKMRNKSRDETSRHDPYSYIRSRIPRFHVTFLQCFFLPVAAPGIPDETAYWEQSARPRNFRYSTTEWSATSCTCFSRKLLFAILEI